jgi:hypothetical protein
MPSWRAFVALLVVALLIIGYALDLAWLVAVVVVLTIALLIFYALGLLAQGQREWFDREQRRR